MLAEFIDRIASLARSSQTVQFHHDPLLPRTVFVRHGDKMTQHEQEEPLIEHEVINLESFVSFVSMDLENDQSEFATSVFVNYDGATAILQDGGRIESCTLRFQKSKTAEMLEKMRGGMSGTPKAILREMRNVLGLASDHPAIVGLSRVNFTRRSDGHAHVERGRESLGRTVEAEVQQADKIPESFTVRVPLFVTPGLLAASTFDTEVQILLDLDDEKIELFVNADSFELGKVNALTDSRNIISQQVACAVYCGEHKTREDARYIEELPKTIIHRPSVDLGRI